MIICRYKNAKSILWDYTSRGQPSATTSNSSGVLTGAALCQCSRRGLCITWHIHLATLLPKSTKMKRKFGLFGRDVRGGGKDELNDLSRATRSASGFDWRPNLWRLLPECELVALPKISVSPNHHLLPLSLSLATFRLRGRSSTTFLGIFEKEKQRWLIQGRKRVTHAVR